MRRGVVLLAAVVLAGGGLLLAWQASELGVEPTYGGSSPGTGRECGSVVRPGEEPGATGCSTVLDDQLRKTLAVFYLAEILLLGSAWIAVSLGSTPPPRRWPDVLAGVVALVLSPLFLLPGEMIGFTSGFGEPTVAAEVWLFLGALPVPLAMAAIWGLRGSRTRSVVVDDAIEPVPS